MKKLLLLLFKLWSYIVTLGSWENNHGMQLLRRQTKLRLLEESAWALVQRCFSYNVNKLNRRNLNLHCACSNTFWNERMVLIVRGTAPFGRYPKIFGWNALLCLFVEIYVAGQNYNLTFTFSFDDVFRKILSGITDIPLFPSAQFFYWYFLPTTANSLLWAHWQARRIPLVVALNFMYNATV